MYFFLRLYHLFLPGPELGDSGVPKKTLSQTLSSGNSHLSMGRRGLGQIQILLLMLFLKEEEEL